MVASGPAGRAGLDRNRSAILEEASFPAYGDVPRGKRLAEDTIVARLRWTPGLLSDATASDALILHRRGRPPACHTQASSGGLVARQRPVSGRLWLSNALTFDTYRAGNNEIEIASGFGPPWRTSVYLAGGHDPAWSPDGRRIVFVSRRDGNDELYLADGRVTPPRRLTHDPSVDGAPEWSPDGNTIVFDRQARSGRYAIWTIGANGGQQRRLTPTREDDAHPAWSPDGREIAFDTIRHGRAEIDTIDAGGGRRRRLTGAGDAYPAWAPNGRTISFESTRDGNAELYTLAVGSHVATRLTRDRASDNRPAWSPDGRLLAFSQAEGSLLDEIVVMDADRMAWGVIRRAAPTRLDNPVWQRRHGTVGP